MKPLRRLAPLAAVLALSLQLGCDSPTGSNDPVPARVDIVSGDLQTQTVAKELAAPLVVKVLDDKGQAVKGQAVNFAVTAGGGSVIAGAALTDDNGEARARWTLGTVAGDTQRVEARAVNAATGAALVLATFRAVATADVPSSIAPAGPASFTGLPLLALADSVAAVVRDVYGNPVPGTAVVWTVKQGGGTVSPGTSTTGSTGVARTRWTLGGQVDSLQVIEAAAGLTLKTQFTANGRVPSDAVVVKVSGDAQTDTAGQILPQPLVVRVQRADGTPVAGIPVTFTLPAGSGSVTPATSVSNAAGQVSVQWTLGTGAGTKTATAALGNGASVGFTATALAGAVVALQKVSGDGQAVRVASVLADSLVIRAVDANGNPVAGVGITWLPVGGGSTYPGTTNTGADGRSAVVWTLGRTSVQTVTASTPGVPPARFTAGTRAVYMTLLAPDPRVVVGDNVVVTVRVDSALGSVASVQAEAGGHTAALTSTGGTTVQGTLSLAGLPHGALDVRIRAVTAAGDSSAMVVPVFHDTPPVATFTSPHTGTVARPSVRVDADCVDDSGSCSLTVTASTTFQSASNQTTVLRATGSIHQDVSLAAFEGFDVHLRVIASDSVGHSVTAGYDIPVESSTRLTEVASAGDWLLDFDATRYLVGDQIIACCGRFGLSARWVVRQVDRGTGASVVVDSGATLRLGAAIYSGRLHPQGALFTSPGGNYDWRAGTSTQLGTNLSVANGWAVYVAGGVKRLELATGVVTPVGAGDQPDVADNGDVAFHAGGGVWRYRAGVTSNVAAAGQYPVTDGVNVAYVDASNHVALSLGAGGTVDLGPAASFGSAGPAHTRYEVQNGWTAYLLSDAGGIAQVWVRSPAGVVTGLTSVGQSAELMALGDNGQVVYRTGGSAYVAQSPYTAAPVRVFSGLFPREVRFRGTQLLLFRGRTAFDVSY